MLRLLGKLRESGFDQMIIARMMSKDWGFAGTLRDQAKRFLDLAKQTPSGSEQEGCVRASIVFSVISFEAFFFREIIRGYIQQHASVLDPNKIGKIERGLSGNGGFTGISGALENWPRLLTGAEPLPLSLLTTF